jgi:hypothetical protein
MKCNVPEDLIVQQHRCENLADFGYSFEERVSPNMLTAELLPRASSLQAAVG